MQTHTVTFIGSSVFMKRPYLLVSRIEWLNSLFFFCEGKPNQREELTIRICISRDTHLSISPSEQVIRKKQRTKKSYIKKYGSMKKMRERQEKERERKLGERN